MAHIAKPVSYSQTWTFFEGKWHEGNAPIMGPRTHAAWLASTVFDGGRAFEGVAPDLDRHCARIIDLVKSILEQNAIAAVIAPDTRLVDAGLTSMDMVNLMLGVEAEFDFMIPQDQITPENFRSVETLVRLVATQLRAAA